MWFQRNRLPVDWQAQRTIIDGFKYESTWQKMSEAC